MSELTIYLKIFGLAEDEDGNDAYAGVKIGLGEVSKLPPYDEIARSIKKEALPNLICMQGLVKPEDIVIITPEEYERDYGDESEDEDEPN